MTLDDVGLIIPFRDRGRDPLRAANLNCVAAYWRRMGFSPMIVSDGREGDAQFNRSAAYNIGTRHYSKAKAFIYAESDMLVPFGQVKHGVFQAMLDPGLVVPFSEYCYLSAKDSCEVRGGANPEVYTPESVIPDGKSIGAINIISRETLGAVGQWDEVFEGSWYDDTAMNRAFTVCAGPTRTIPGPAWHLYHLPGWSGKHLTEEDRQATSKNRLRWRTYALAKTPERIRELTAGGGPR